MVPEVDTPFNRTVWFRSKWAAPVNAAALIKGLRGMKANKRRIRAGLPTGTLSFGLAAAWVLFAAAVWLAAQGIATRNAPPAPRGTASGKPFLAKFSDIAAQAGLSMRFTFGGETAKKYIVEANGTGVAFVDYDNDGRLDIFLVNGSRLEGYGDGEAPTNHLYRNTGVNGFVDVTRKAGLARAGWGSGVCAGDVDNDGHLDFYVTYWGPTALSH